MTRKVEVRMVGAPSGHSLPAYSTTGSAGLDLRASLPEAVTIAPGGRRLIPTGISVNMGDPGMVAIVASRSGLSLNHGLRVAQGVGVIDSDYHGEIGVILANDGAGPYTVHPGDRIAQLLFLPVLKVTLEAVDSFGTSSERGSGGFGHTGRS